MRGCTTTVASAEKTSLAVGISLECGKEVSLGTIREGRRREVKVTIREFRDQALTS